ncbi:MAG: CusA/CzcA family heavy metal efflux RND transporter [Blastopirellula sp.]|nr:MAG: CusA/CzcA family heavy metal efflux RND transporter [Blastopirellula sp.]
MLNGIIRFALSNRLLIVCTAIAMMILGSMVAQDLRIDVLPDLTRPRVTILTECPGMAPEEVEQRVTFPLESAINGAAGVTDVRSASDIGLSVITVEFEWGADIYTARQIVDERIASAAEILPSNVHSELGAISSLLGQIMIVGMWSEDDTTSPMEVRTLADWVVRQRLKSIPGISQVITMGGERKQFQVLVDLHKMHEFEVSLAEIEEALIASNLNITGGYLEKNSQDLLVRGIGQIESIEDVKKVVVKSNAVRSILIDQVATVIEGPQIKRGDARVNGKDAVVLTIQKQPQADTRKLTDEVEKAVEELRSALPDDVIMDATLYRQREFIDYSVKNVEEALRDGAILVAIVLFLFLLNLRTTVITLAAIPVSVIITVLVFRWFDMSINVMTLGGIAVALGELVDDAIVDVENIFRRLKENTKAENPKPVLTVIYNASVEVRHAIIVSTILVIVVFAPLFALTGMEGRLFVPLGIAYIVSILASTLVSLTLTPVLSYYLLPNAKVTHKEKDGLPLRVMKYLATPVIRISMTTTGLSIILLSVILSVAFSVITVVNMGKDFLPEFDEGATQVNLYVEPGTSLSKMQEISRIADVKFKTLLKTEENPDAPLLSFICRMGRAEQDEHVMGVNVAEYILTANPDSKISRSELIETLHHKLEDIQSAEKEIEQPIAHLISHMLSGVTAQIAIKLYGDDLDVLRSKAQEIKAAISDVEGIADPVVEQQQIVSQLRIEVDRDALAFHGLSAKYVLDYVETAMNGKVISKVYQDQRWYDLVVRFDEENRNDVTNISRFPIETPSGKRIPLGEVAHIYEGGGPNTINRENSRRRIVVRVNTMDRALGDVVADIKSHIKDEVDFPEGYFVVYGGQFEAQQTASSRILWLSLVAMAVVFVVLYSTYPSTSLVLQILLALPAAFVGGVAALLITNQSLSIASMVGFISLGGIAARNGLLLVSTYLDLTPEMGFKKEMILKGSLDRLAPVLMTALTTGIGLVPLVIGGHLPGKEMLFPVATVILGGLVTSTLCEFLVRPGLFLVASEKAVERLTKQKQDAVELDV